MNRRNFLRGAGTVAVGLPFLEGLPERSAWAADAVPVFTFFAVAQNGVVGDQFFPAATGAITADGLMGDKTKATNVLATHAQNLLFIKGINYTKSGPQSCGHAEGNVQTLTGLAPGSTGNGAYGAGPSADTSIAKVVNPSGGDPFALYAGTKGFIAERISFKAAGAGQVRAADVNPYTLYSKLITSVPATATTGTTTPTTTVDPVMQELAVTRKSVNDLVRAELNSLMGMSALSSNDKQRLKHYFDTIRDTEIKMDAAATGAACSKAGFPTDKYDALKSGYAFKATGAMMEDTIMLHLQLVALAFGCNYNRVGTLQWGDGTDGTKYDVPSNQSLGWSFHQLSHRIMSDSASGNNPTAKAAHHEIDELRMKSLAFGMDAFKAHGLQSNSMLVWTNTIADGPSHSMAGVPMIIWGSGGGFLKQGTFIDAASANNSKVLNTIMAAATRDKGTAPTIAGSGLLASMMA